MVIHCIWVYDKESTDVSRKIEWKRTVYNMYTVLNVAAVAATTTAVCLYVAAFCVNEGHIKYDVTRKLRSQYDTMGFMTFFFGVIKSFVYFSRFFFFVYFTSQKQEKKFWLIAGTSYVGSYIVHLRIHSFFHSFIVTIKLNLLMKLQKQQIPGFYVFQLFINASLESLK